MTERIRIHHASKSIYILKVNKVIGNYGEISEGKYTPQQREVKVSYNKGRIGETALFWYVSQGDCGENQRTLFEYSTFT